MGQTAQRNFHADAGSMFSNQKKFKKPKERGGGGSRSAQQFLMTVDTWALWYTLFKKVLGLFSKLPLVPQKFQTTSQFQSTPNVRFYNLKVYPNFTLAFTFFFKLLSIFFVISRQISWKSAPYPIFLFILESSLANQPPSPTNLRIRRNHPHLHLTS